MNCIRKEDGSICVMRLIIMIAILSAIVTIGGFLIGKFLEKE